MFIALNHVDNLPVFFNLVDHVKKTRTMFFKHRNIRCSTLMIKVRYYSENTSLAMGGRNDGLCKVDQFRPSQSNQ